MFIPKVIRPLKQLPSVLGSADDMNKLIIATRNVHKVGEIQAILGGQFECRSLAEFPGAPAVEEDAETFAGNARKKAVEIAAWIAQEFSHRPGKLSGLAGGPAASRIMADDSGLEVDLLNGAPGVLSARFAQPDLTEQGNSSDEANNEKLLRLMSGAAEIHRSARFRCVIALASVPTQPSPGGFGERDDTGFGTILFDGVCEGKILDAPRGAGGFGYDPLFVPLGFTETFAELGEDLKNQISHRAQALHRMRAFFERL